MRFAVTTLVFVACVSAPKRVEHPWEAIDATCKRRPHDTCGRGWDLTCKPNGYIETRAPDPATVGEGKVDAAACDAYCPGKRGLDPCSVWAQPNGWYTVWCDRCSGPPE